MDRTSLRQVMVRLAAAGLVPRAAPLLAAGQQVAGTTFRQDVLAEIPAFSATGNPDVLPGLDQHANDHLAEVVRLLAGGDIGDLAFVKAHARLRAEQRFPLEATLHAYRCGHRTLSRWLRDAATAAAPPDLEQAVSTVADFAIEYTNIISAIATAEYVAHTRMLAEAEGDRRIELLNILLSGYDESDGRVTQILKRAGYLEQRQAYCIVVAQSTNASEMESPARAQRIANAISDTMGSTSIRTLTGSRNNLVVAVLSERRRISGWTAPQSSLSGRVCPLLLGLGPAVLVGVSADHPSTSYLPKALHEATVALDVSNVAQRVVDFASIPIRALLVHRGADYVQSAAPAWVLAFQTANEKSQGAMIATLRGLADADMNVQKAARQLGNHPNTLYARIERIRELTGLDAQHYGDLTELLLAADCSRI